MGFFSLSTHGAKIWSKNWYVSLSRDTFLGKEPAKVGRGKEITGTRIDFTLNTSIQETNRTIQNCARYFPLPVSLNQTPLPQEDFLKDALSIHQIEGARIGVFPSYHKEEINFFGLTITDDTRNKTVNQSLKTKWNEGLCTSIDVTDTRALQLVLPARNAVVQNDNAKLIRKECRKALYTYLARQTQQGGHHELPYENYLEAKALGIDLGEAKPLLRQLVGDDSHCSEVLYGDLITVNPTNCLVLPEQEHGIAHCLEYAANSDRNFPNLVLASKSYEGYSWYAKLPKVDKITAKIDNHNIKLDLLHVDPCTDWAVPKALLNKKAKSITITFHSKRKTWSVQTPLFISYSERSSYRSSDYGEWIVTRKHPFKEKIHELEDILTAAFFEYNDNYDSDSSETQRENFEREISQEIHEYLFDEETSIKLAIEEYLTSYNFPTRPLLKKSKKLIKSITLTPTLKQDGNPADPYHWRFEVNIETCPIPKAPKKASAKKGRKSPK
jgi:hypothetical protein